VLHCHMAGFHIIPAVMVARRFGRPVVVKIACAGARGDVQRLRALSTDSGGELGPLAALLLGRATAVIAPSTEIERELRHQGYERAYHIPNGVDVGRFRPASGVQRAAARASLGLPDSSFLLGFMGRLDKQKGVDVLIQAWSKTKFPARGGLLCIAGEGREAAALRGMAADLRAATDTVRFLGRVGPAEFLRALDGFVLPSRYEGMPNALLEAMASGLACLGTQIGGTEDLVQHGRSGLLVPADRVRPLALALESLSDSRLRDQLGKAARSRAETSFSLQAIAGRYHDLYRLLAASPASRRADSMPSPPRSRTNLRARYRSVSARKHGPSH
jgi:glycosyltransferase involved in cell wall biosynthesis